MYEMKDNSFPVLLPVLIHHKCIWDMILAQLATA